MRLPDARLISLTMVADCIAVRVALSEADVCLINGGYASLYIEKLILYQGKQCLFKRLGRYLFEFKADFNIFP